VRVFKTKAFARFARRERIADHALREAIARAERGLIDADLGGGIIKLRLARPGQGRSGGFRLLAAYRASQLGIYLYGFAKNERDNVDDDQLQELRKAARFFFGLTDAEVDLAVSASKLTEISDA
jgi:hypothetical protein